MRTGETINRRGLSVSGGRFTVGGSMCAMTRSFGPIQQVGITVEFRCTTFAGPGQPIHRGASPVVGGFPTDLRQPVGSVCRKPRTGCPLDPFTGLVVFCFDPVSFIGGEVAFIGVPIPLGTDLVSPISRSVPPLGRTVAHVGGTVVHVGGAVPLICDRLKRPGDPTRAHANLLQIAARFGALLVGPVALRTRPRGLVRGRELARDTAGFPSTVPTTHMDRNQWTLPEINQEYPIGHARWNRPGSEPLLISDGPLPANLALARADGLDELTGVALMPTLRIVPADPSDDGLDRDRTQQRLET
jgi:hypothetical protein